MSAFGLPRMPNEIWLLIIKELEFYTSSLYNLRLASRALNELVLPTLVEQRFRTRCVMLWQDSLEELDEISRHPVFGPAMRHLKISIVHLLHDHHAEHGDTDIAVEGEEMDDSDEGQAIIQRNMRHLILERDHAGTEQEGEPDGTEENGVRTPHCLALEDQQFMTESGLNTAYLVQAMSRLKLETISIDRPYTQFAVATMKRKRGLEGFNDEITKPDSIRFMEQAIRAVVSAIVASKVSFWDLIIGDWMRQFSPDMLGLPRPLVRCIQNNPIHLASLGLFLEPKNMTRPDDEWASNLIDFITLFPSLDRLELDIVTNRGEECLRFPEFCEGLRLQWLRELVITGLRCDTPDALASLIIGHKDTLRRISLVCTHINAGIEGWRALLTIIRDEFPTEPIVALVRCGSGWDQIYCYRDEGEDVTYLDIINEIRGQEDMGLADMIKGLAITTEDWEE